MASSKRQNDGIQLYINGKRTNICRLDDEKLDKLIESSKALVDNCERQLALTQEMLEAIKLKLKAAKAELASWEELKHIREERSNIFDKWEETDE